MRTHYHQLQQLLGIGLLLGFGLSAQAAEPTDLKVAFQPQENPLRLQLNAEKMSKFLSTQLGRPVKVYVPTDYAAVVEALREGHVQVAYLSSWPSVIAHQMAGAEVILAEQRHGSTSYQSCYYVRQDSPIKTLADARGKKVAFVDPIDTCGYVFPVARLVDDHLLKAKEDPRKFFSEILFAEGYEPTLKALVNGQVDIAACADFAAKRYLSPAEFAQVRVLCEQGPVPTHVIAVAKSVTGDLREQITKAFVALNEPANKELLESVYGADGLTPVNHKKHLASLHHALEVTGFKYPLDHPEEDDD